MSCENFYRSCNREAHNSKSKIFEPVNQLTTVNEDSSLENENAKQIKELYTLIKLQSQQQWQPRQILATTSLPPLLQNNYNKHQRVGNGVRGVHKYLVQQKKF
jgi:hypothetical protein